MEKTYWNDCGRYQNFADRLAEEMPNYGYTTNNNMNIYIVACHFYYDCYNNGGCNYDVYMKDYEGILPIELRKEFSFVRKDGIDEKKLKRLCGDYDFAEMFMDRVLKFLQDKDCSYEKLTLYFNNKKREISSSYKENWDTITFGLEEEKTNWVNARKRNLGDKVVE